MTNMYLLFEWTEEREAKMHLAITSTVEKAKEAALLSWKNDGKQRGATEEELEDFTIEWEEHEFGTIGNKKSSDDEDLIDGDDDNPFEIELFKLDMLQLGGYDAETRKMTAENVAL